MVALVPYHTVLSDARVAFLHDVNSLFHLLPYLIVHCLDDVIEYDVIHISLCLPDSQVSDVCDFASDSVHLEAVTFILPVCSHLDAEDAPWWVFIVFFHYPLHVLILGMCVGKHALECLHVFMQIVESFNLYHLYHFVFTYIKRSLC